MSRQKKQVILLGDSVILAGIQASLRDDLDLEIVALDKFSSQPEGENPELCPVAVIFELGSTAAELPPAILHQTGLLLIGIDPEINRMLFWSGKQASGLTLQDLAQIIHQINSKTDQKGA